MKALEGRCFLLFFVTAAWARDAWGKELGLRGQDLEGGEPQSGSCISPVSPLRPFRGHIGALGCQHEVAQSPSATSFSVPKAVNAKMGGFWGDTGAGGSLGVPGELA